MISKEEFVNILKEVSKEEADEGPEITFSNKFKQKMNRVFRERAGAPIPHPEMDNIFERTRIGIVKIFLRIFNGS